MAFVRLWCHLFLLWCAALPAVAQEAPFVRDVFRRINAQRSQTGSASIHACMRNAVLELFRFANEC